ncbi:nuclear transport factor 2 family protein [Nonomuraea sp. SBT364]|uniref:nuclear transport factor 2 family protein n=1 Tax=Nonomuraea sp. SBT364 TaxID=1580530 RepID=UPI0009EB5A32|nr:nuclear transport factor 2 family protein [Nonomuraea sp. SBT364]
MRRGLAIAGTAAAVLAAGVVAAVAGGGFPRAGAGATAHGGDSPAGDATGSARPQPRPAASTGSLDPAARRYLDAVAAGDADALAAAFAPGGLVVDVGREIRGRDAIRRWAADEVIGGVYELLGHTPRAGGVSMLVRFRPAGAGGFRANYHFDITDGLITKATLEYA